MNIVICNGPGVLDNGQEVILFPSRWDSGIPHGHKKPFAFYPYELAALSTLLKRESELGNMPMATVKMLDPNIESWNGDRTIQEIAKYKPDVLICECSALTYPTMTRVMQELVRNHYGTQDEFRAILCGPMGSYDAPTAHGDGWDDVVKGEYELTVLELLGGIVPDEARTDAGLINLDWLPWPEDEDCDPIRYDEINHRRKGYIQMYPTRGCSLGCTFCVVPTLYGGHGKSHKSHRVRDVNDVCDQILYYKDRYGAKMNGCYFNEETHNNNVPWLTDLCNEFIKRGMKDKYGLRFDAMTGAWLYTREIIELMARAGYDQIRFGVESTSEQVGKAIHKTIHKQKVETLLGWAKEFDVHCYVTLQVGAMGSTEQSDLATIADAKEWIRKGLVHRWQLSTSTPQRNTPFYDLCKSKGYLITENPEDFDGYRATCDFPDYPAHRIQKVRDECGL